LRFPKYPENQKEDKMSDILELVKNKDPGEKEFHQAVTEVMVTIKPVLDQHPEFRGAKIMERIESGEYDTTNGSALVKLDLQELAEHVAELVDTIEDLEIKLAEIKEIVKC
jgi:hypothetical protein